MQNLKLQVLWLNSSLGLAVNQETEEGIIPLTPYYFWPISEAWEQICFELDSRLWITKNERVKMLNLIVDVMNQWQKDQVNLNPSDINKKRDLVVESLNILGTQ